MLYGIRPHEQERLAAAGERMRVYVPYGDEWYGYLVRRMAERPANLALLPTLARDQGIALSSGAPMARGRVAVLGAGKMGEALLSGHAARRHARPADVLVTARRPERAAELRERLRRRGRGQRRGGGAAPTP